MLEKLTKNVRQNVKTLCLYKTYAIKRDRKALCLSVLIVLSPRHKAAGDLGRGDYVSVF